MRCTHWGIVTLSAALGLSPVGAFAQGALDVQRPKPVVMLLVDTSGSMERMPGYGSDPSVAEYPTCTTSKSEKNRWAVTLEALTGTFQSYQCRVEQREAPKYRAQYDYNYHIPHHNFTSLEGDFVVAATQASDGVIDSFSNRIKFGLMTFDGVGTTLNGDTLVELPEFDQPGFRGKTKGAEGMYSYGKVGSLVFPGCHKAYGVDFGARGPNAPTGGMIAVGDDGADIAIANENVQKSLLAVRPFGGTPTAAILDDLRYYLEKDDSVKSGSDKYFRCRDRYAVLITDGAPDKLFRDSRFQCQNTNRNPECPGNECLCPYETEMDIAGDMHGKNLLKELVVIGLDVDADTGAILDGISQRGGGKGAIKASQPSQLQAELSKLLTSLSSDAATRSSPQIVHNGLPPFAGGKQYEITAGFRLPGFPEMPWDGLLFRRRFGCDANAPVELALDEAQGDFFHTSLKAQARGGNRLLYTALPDQNAAASVDGTLVTQAAQNASPTRSSSRKTYNTKAPDGSTFTKAAADSSINARQETTEFGAIAAFSGSLSENLFSSSGSSSEKTAVRNRVVSYVRAEDPQVRPEALADIYHSNPVVLPPVTLNSSALNTADAQLNSMLRGLLTSTGNSGSSPDYGSDGRPGVVFVGTNDGVLHAFNLDTWRDREERTFATGHEFWGFVPPALFGKLATASLPTHQEMFDGTPLVRNMMLQRTANGGQFATVLVSAVRGAPAYVALDVTRPEREPKLLWQFSRPGMGLTVATPALAQARLLWDDGSEPRERAIAILPGGTGVESAGCADSKRALVSEVTQTRYPSVARSAVRCWQQRGRSLYVVDVATGALIQEFGSEHFPSPLTGSVAVDSSGLDVARAAYFTDHDGVLWRLSMLDPDPEKWIVEPIWDIFHDETSSVAYKKGRPSIHPPLLSRDPAGNYVILVGTGDVDNLVEASPAQDPLKHRVVSLTETRVVSSGVGGLTLNSDSAVTLNWEKKLEVGESVTGPLSLFDQVTYFGTFAAPSGGDACDFGFSRIWGLDYLKADSGKVPLGRWPDGVDANNQPKYVSYITQDLESSLVLGVSIAATPLCVSSTTIDPFSPSQPRMADGAQVGGGGFQIRALLSGKRNGDAAKDELTGFQRSLNVSNNARMMGWGGAVE